MEVTLAYGISFSRSLRALQHESRHRVWAGIVVAAMLLLAWGAWFVSASLPVQVLSRTARVEIEARVHAIQSPLVGSVVAVHGSLGQEVHAGELLFQLDDVIVRRQLDEEQARLSSAHAELEAARGELEHETEALNRLRRANALARDEASSREAAAKSAEAEATDEATRASTLLDRALVAEAEYRKLTTRAQGLRATTEAVALGRSRLEWEQGQEESRREAHLDELRRQIARLEGEVRRGASTVERLNAEIRRYAIRAPTDGRIGELAAVRPGSVVAAGEALGALVPDGRLRIAATFAPECLGRLRAGQPAEVRLEAYPWPQFGVLRAVVATVGSELRGGGVPVMLEVDGGGARLPLEHGLVASVSVEVERTTPAWLALRSAGLLLEPERTPSPESHAPLTR